MMTLIMAVSPIVDRLGQDTLDAVDRALQCEVSPYMLPARCPEFRFSCSPVPHGQQRSSQCLGIAGWNQEAFEGAEEDLRGAADTRSNCRTFAGHGLERHSAKRLICPARQDEYVGCLV